MRLALPAAVGEIEAVSLEEAEAARKKTHETALAEIDNRRLEQFCEGDEVWVQNRITAQPPRMRQICVNIVPPFVWHNIDAALLREHSVRRIWAH